MHTHKKRQGVGKHRGITLVKAWLLLQLLVMWIKSLRNCSHVIHDVLGFTTSGIPFMLAVLENIKRGVRVEVEHCEE